MHDKLKAGTFIHGYTRLLKEATISAVDLVEAMHYKIIYPPFLPTTPMQKLISHFSGFSYNNVRKGIQLTGAGVEWILEEITPLIKQSKPRHTNVAFQSVVNGLVGDYLEQTDNPLSIEMQFRYHSERMPINKKNLKANFGSINGKILLMIHGSCMNETQWTREGHNHGLSIAEAFGMTPIFLRYNSGKHISHNGKTLSKLINELIRNWPVQVEEINIIAHSMGGLVARSAIYYGKENDSFWTEKVKKMVFLGTPHLGAPLEKIGSYLDAILENIHYTNPLSRLGKIRSSGITDLRFGNLIDEDWEGSNWFSIGRDRSSSIALPEGIECYSVAAVVGNKTESRALNLLGDLLVSVNSALGRHHESAKSLFFKEENVLISYETNHLALLNKQNIYEQLKSWFEIS